VHAATPSDQTPLLTTTLEESRHHLSNGQAYMHDGAVVGLW